MVQANRPIEVVDFILHGVGSQLATMRDGTTVEVAGTPVDGVDDLQRLMAGELIGRTVEARLLRQGREVTVELVPDELSS